MGKFKLNYKDQRLLELLDTNSRSTLVFLAEKLNLSKQAIRIKLKGFIQRGIILNYVSIINFFKLGYNNMHLYLMLQGIDRETYNRKIEEINKIREIVWIAELFGESDLGISILYKDISELSEILAKIDRIFGSFITQKEVYFINRHFISSINLISQNLKVTELSHDKKTLNI